MQLSRRDMWVGALLIAAQALVLYLMGQPTICTCGYVKLWEGVVLSSGNSQHLMDWYTFSHIIHGLLFYLGLWYFFPRLSVGMRLLLALGIEIAWEIVENTPVVIDHYRQQALAQGYIGDSILNSLSDTFAMLLGFVLAWRAPLWSTIALGVGLELFVLYMIRDNLALNVINLIYPLEFISKWQIGG
ncbi:hypothetical protein A2763_03165 [Candidatus Kaiserbacteria bacterium RIFCSPHIGHO2_01_FULL_54_36]|uniref:Uncharacterized protein n=1 Tax=Candidatus Kaiserbacteria bacterium RIFCSPHIGHO2_01_FULL_54_36 TaxID=1798482 RepID=A0A1F6CKI7_9BACT|nr:MAG: hypothetical protein A2763_03165 [Candidatus Kaiserbacteria bacterium RIFCSPHIGHO2_01_FULL_54_36]OGG75399.1 MAG: hypothetical protein A3A41_02420 [Candidatus Kaiserbacteria bacterium RIFCSPLOWO2_01_FULL_54_22]